MHKLIIYFFVFILSLSITHAQVQKGMLFGGRAKTGYYILNANPQVGYTGKIKVYAKELIVKNSQGKDLKYKADEVYWAKIDTIRYTTANNFTIKSGFGSFNQTSKLFVEIVDSGQVSLYRYNYSYPGSAAGSTTDLVTFILHDATTNSITTLPVSVYTGKGQRFREALTPYVEARPDLLQLLEDGHITIDNLPLLLHALNYAEPFPIKFKAKKVKERVVEDPFGGN